MNSDQLASMYAEIVNGTPKAKSRFRTASGFDAAWDKVSAEVAAIRAQGGNPTFQIPNEVPSAGV